MKKILYTVLILLAAAVTAQAQTTNKRIEIRDVKTTVADNMLYLAFNVEAHGIDIKCDGHLVVEFAVENDERRFVLPPVKYTGKLRNRYEKRYATLSNDYPREYYQVFNGVKKNKTYESEYLLEVPYYEWMEHAAVTYREYMHDCSGNYLAGNGQLVADLNPLIYTEPEVWKPNPVHFPNIVGFLVAQPEEVKARASMIELNIGFPVNITEVRPTFGDNRYELQRADTMITMLHSNELIDIRSVNIRGYASPEGSYNNNVRLAKGRSEGFKQYLINKYPDNQYIRSANTSWIPEDWAGLARLVRASNIPNKNEVLGVVEDDAMAPDTKEAVLKTIGQWSQVYKVMLDDMFPRLRRMELRVDYTVQNLSDAKARELIYTNPELLSLDEMYRVALYYTPGSDQFKEVYGIAVRQYPDDVIANNNAAAALLQEARAEEALPYLEKTKNDPRSYINYGAYWYVMGDLDKAKEYFTMAKEAGNAQADHNLQLIIDERSANIGH